MNNINISLIICILILLIYFISFKEIAIVSFIAIMALTYIAGKSHNDIVGAGETLEEYPFKKTFYPPDSAKKMMEKLKLVVPNISKQKRHPHNIKFKETVYKNGPLIVPTDCVVTFIHKDSDYENFDVIGDLFTEYARLSARLSYKDKSPLEEWQNKEYRNSFTGTRASIREQLYERTPEATQFKPSLMVQVIKYLFAEQTKGIHILDPSAGWGDRLIGAIALDVGRYSGFDPNTNLIAGHKEIIEYFGVDKEKFTVEYKPFESHDVVLAGQYDIIFTSPPFFDFEVYTDIAGQSIKTYPNIRDWLNGFLFVMLDKSWASLKVGGYCVIHIADSYKIHICEPMCLYILANFMDAEYIGCYCSVGKAGKPRPMWVFKKNNGKNKSEINIEALKDFRK
jgi:hypothetical protein